MVLDFQQGIVTHPMTGAVQAFLSKTGSYVSFTAMNGRTDIAFANGDQNYLLTEAEDVPNAWGPLAGNTNYWLYWDIDMRTAVRTHGFTTTAPVVAPYAPPHVEGLHWFNSITKRMYVSQSNTWREVLRVFAARVNNSTFTSLSQGYGSRPFAGTQVGLNVPNVRIGRIIIDSLGSPIRRASGQFFTTEDDFFVDGSPVNTIRLESNVAYATAVTIMPRFSVVKFTDFGEIDLAEYDDAGSTAIALLMEDLIANQVGTVSIQGVVTNPLWDWPVVGVPLWISTNGQLTSTDPHLADPITWPISRVPVARVLSPMSVFFDQGLGLKGDKGDPGDVDDVYASPIRAGVTKLSVGAAAVDNPIAVGDNDPRVVQALLRTGGTMTGTLVLNANPTANLHAATKQYVDSTVAAVDLSSRVAKSGDTMTGPLTLSGDPTVNLHAATKQYVDDAIGGVDLSSRVAKAGDTMTGPLNLNYTPTLGSEAVHKDYVDDAVAGISALQSSPVVTVATASRVITPADVDNYLRFTATGAKTCTFDAVNSLNVPEEYHIANRASTGNLTLVGAGITLNPPKLGTLVLEPNDTVTVKMITPTLADVFGSTAAYLGETVLLLHFEEGPGVSIVDSSGTSKTVTKAGDATQSNTTEKWGLYGSFASSGGLVTQSSVDFAMGTGDFSYDFWFTQVNGAPVFDRCLLDTRYSGGVGFRLYASRPGTSFQLSVIDSSGTFRTNPAAVISDNVQYFVCVTRVNGVVSIQLNNTVVFSYTDAANYTDTVTCFGNQTGLSSTMNGGFDEIRVIKGAGLTLPIPLPTGPYA